MSGISVRYENDLRQLESVRRVIRANIHGPEVRIIFDPRVSESPDMIGGIVAASSGTDMVVVRVDDRQAEDTLRRRTRYRDEWWISVPMAEILDVVRT